MTLDDVLSYVAFPSARVLVSSSREGAFTGYRCSSPELLLLTPRSALSSLRSSPLYPHLLQEGAVDGRDEVSSLHPGLEG